MKCPLAHMFGVEARCSVVPQRQIGVGVSVTVKTSDVLSAVTVADSSWAPSDMHDNLNDGATGSDVRRPLAGGVRRWSARRTPPSLRPARTALCASVAFDNKSLRIRLHA